MEILKTETGRTSALPTWKGLGLPGSDFFDGSPCLLPSRAVRRYICMFSSFRSISFGDNVQTMALPPTLLMFPSNFDVRGKCTRRNAAFDAARRTLPAAGRQGACQAGAADTRRAAGPSGGSHFLFVVHFSYISLSLSFPLSLSIYIYIYIYTYKYVSRLKSQSAIFCTWRAAAGRSRCN